MKPPAQALPYALRVYVRKIRITGNTVFKPEELEKIATPYENRYITNNDLEELRQKLTLYYVNHGYINSGAVIPDQKIANDTIEIHIIEGRLQKIDVEGTKRFHKSYFSDRLAAHAGPPLNVKNLEQELELMLQDPLVQNINAQLVPGDHPGEAVLKTQVTEAPPYDFTAVLDNKISPSLGEEIVRLSAETRNVSGRGDVLSGEFDYAQGIPHDIKARYRRPVNVHNTAYSLYYENASSKIVQHPFDQLDITSQYENWGVQVTQPVHWTPNRHFTLGAVLEWKSEQTKLLGVPFSFSPGVDNGKSAVSVLRLVQDFVGRSRNQVISARSTISVGLDAFGSTMNPDDQPDSRFVAWLAQVQWARRFGKRGQQLYFSANGQISDASLLPLEQFSVGGLDSVRGFRTDQLVRDRGYTASLEYRIPLFANPTGWRNTQFAAFVDTGGAKNREGPNPGPSYLTGAGFGFIFDPSRQFHAEVYATPWRTNIDQPGSYSIQDSGIYFRLVGHLP